MKPRKPLERRTPMPRGTTPLRRTELKRSSSIRSRGSVGDASPDGLTTKPAGRRNGPTKPRLESSTIPPAIRAAVLERDGYTCVRCGVHLEGRRYSLHHRRRRGAGGSRLLHTLANLVTVCGTGTTGCHGELESRRADSYATGWLVPNGAVPEEWPVLRWTVAGARWMQPGDEWTDAVPHARQLEMGAAA